MADTTIAIQDQRRAIGEAIRDYRREMNRVKEEDVKVEYQSLIEALEAASLTLRNIEVIRKSLGEIGFLNLENS